MVDQTEVSIFGSSTLIPPLLSGDGKLLVDSNDKAELLNETFSVNSLMRMW